MKIVSVPKRKVRGHSNLTPPLPHPAGYASHVCVGEPVHHGRGQMGAKWPTEPQAPGGQHEPTDAVPVRHRQSMGGQGNA